MLTRRLGRQPNIGPTLFQFLVFAGSSFITVHYLQWFKLVNGLEYAVNPKVQFNINCRFASKSFKNNSA